MQGDVLEPSSSGGPEHERRVRLGTWFNFFSHHGYRMNSSMTAPPRHVAEVQSSLQWYRNPVDTHWYLPDEPMPPIHRVAARPSGFLNGSGRTRKRVNKLVMSRGKRFESARRL